MAVNTFRQDPGQRPWLYSNWAWRYGQPNNPDNVAPPRWRTGHGQPGSFQQRAIVQRYQPIVYLWPNTLPEPDEPPLTDQLFTLLGIAAFIALVAWLLFRIVNG